MGMQINASQYFEQNRTKYTMIELKLTWFDILVHNFSSLGLTGTSVKNIHILAATTLIKSQWTKICISSIGADTGNIQNIHLARVLEDAALNPRTIDLWSAREFSLSS